MAASNPSFKAPSTAEVAAALAADAEPAAPAEKTPVAPIGFALSPEALEFAASGGTVELPETTILPDPLTSPEAPTKRKVNSWSFLDADNKEIAGDVSEDERDIYFKAVCFDMPVVFEIPIFNGHVLVTVRSLTEKEDEIVEEAVAQELQDFRVRSNVDKGVPLLSLHTTWYQRFKTVLRLVKFVAKIGAETKTREFDPFPINAKMAECASSESETTDNEWRTGFETAKKDDARKLRMYAKKIFNEMSPALFLGLVTAVRIHELKFVTCAQKAASRNFWVPAGTN
mgnify:CR=1 FL=1